MVSNGSHNVVVDQEEKTMRIEVATSKWDLTGDPISRGAIPNSAAESLATKVNGLTPQQLEAAHRKRINCVYVSMDHYNRTGKFNANKNNTKKSSNLSS